MEWKKDLAELFVQYPQFTVQRSLLAHISLVALIVAKNYKTQLYQDWDDTDSGKPAEMAQIFHSECRCYMEKREILQALIPIYFFRFYSRWERDNTLFRNDIIFVKRNLCRNGLTFLKTIANKQREKYQILHEKRQCQSSHHINLPCWAWAQALKQNIKNN